MAQPGFASALEGALENAAHVTETASREDSSVSSSQPSSATQSGTSTPTVRHLRPPQPSLRHWSSMDKILTYYEEKKRWESSSVAVLDRFGIANSIDQHDSSAPHSRMQGDTLNSSDPQPRPRFRGVLAQIGFCFTVCMTQFLAEFLISGFALELSRLVKGADSHGTGLFWPASLLTLIMSSLLLFFARLSDMYSGYPCFMGGVLWLTLWTFIPGFTKNLIVLDVSRAMQGAAIAAFTPSGYAMIGANYPEGRGRNVIMGLYSGSAPLGFFFGILTAGALPESNSQWYFWTSASLSCCTAVAAYLSIPRDAAHESRKDLVMDWYGAFFITTGLILVAYALAIEPYAGGSTGGESGFSSALFIGPFVSGVGCLLFAVWIEGWVAKCPLLPLSFFRPKSVLALTIAGLFFYATYGVWLYNSIDFLQSRTGTTTPDNPNGMLLALWYLPTAVGGIGLCLVSSIIVHKIPINILLIISGVFWLGAPLILALSPLPLKYWSATFLSMLFATLGIDLTYTVTCIFFSAVQPLNFQGLSGAMCSILVNLAMSFSLPISEIVKGAAKRHRSFQSQADQINGGYQAAFFYGTASAALGIAVVVLFVRIPSGFVDTKPAVQGTASESRLESGEAV